MPSFSTYLVPTTMDVLLYRIIILESRSGLGLFGTKNIGVREFNLPISAEKVIGALHDVDGAQ